MSARTPLRLLGFVFATSAVVLAQCRVEDTIDDRLWPCNENASHDECGERDGKPMTCWEGYCMPSCDPNASPGANEICLDAGVLVETCSPSDDRCPGSLSCYRTDFILNTGICVPFRVCSTDGECEGSERNRCATTILETRYGGEGGGGNSGPWFDHLHCLQDKCDELDSECVGGDICLLRSYARSDTYPDICVPRCDSSDRCPPNYACARNAHASGADQVCVPGVPGARCTSDQDCAVGDCLYIGAGLSTCTRECETDLDCELYTQPAVYFRCARDTPESPGRCVTTGTLGGFECTDGECPEDTPLCTSYSPFVADQGHSECRVECVDGACAPRAGIPHLCLERWGGGCYPGVFPLPCNETAECMSPYLCASITPDGFEFLDSTKICTVPCVENDDCRAEMDDPATPQNEYKSLTRPFRGYCAPDGFCRAPLNDGMPCEHGEQCYSERCDPDPTDPERARKICGVTR